MVNCEESVTSSGQKRRLPELLRLIAKYPKATVANARVIILTPYADQQQFERSHMGSVLTWGMKRKGVDWVLVNPAQWKFDPDGFDAVLCWPYGFRDVPGFVRKCVAIERRARDRGLAVVNSLAKCDFCHTWCLRLWNKAGIQCAKHQRLREWHAIRLKYPLILRTDHLHRGLNMFLVNDSEEARQVSQLEINPPLDLALEFVDTRSSDGYFRKWRSHVIGNKVIPRQVQLSKSWKVNLDEAEPCEQAVEENRQLISQGEPHAGLVALSARALGADIIALDYSKKPDGSYVFWEGNRNFDLSVGGQMWLQYRRTTGRSHEDCVESVRVIGDAIAALVMERAHAR
jgi:hypothetical protein